MIFSPAFVLIAGPNGSGKSFYTSNKDGALIQQFGIKSFDFDLAFSDLYQEFFSIMNAQLEINLENKVREIFLEKIADSLTNKVIFFRFKQISMKKTVINGDQNSNLLG